MSAKDTVFSCDVLI